MLKVSRFNPVVLLVVLAFACACATRHSTAPAHPDAIGDLFLVSVDAQRAYRESRWVDAVRLYQALVEQVPTDASAWFHLANTYARQGAFIPAIHAYEQSLRYDSEQPKAWFNLSSVYLMNAQSAMRHSSSLMRSADPARSMIAERMAIVNDLVNGRVGHKVIVDSALSAQQH